MSETIEKRLNDLGVTLPVAAAPAANYVPYCRTGNLLFTAGQLPLKEGKLLASGQLGRDVDIAAEQSAGLQLAFMERQLSGGEEQIVRPAIGHVVGGGSGGDRKRHAEIA